jgi:ATP-dependent RNA helicase DDX5/DBP2
MSYGGYSGGGYGGGGGGWGGGHGGGGYDDKMSNLGGGLRSVDWNNTKLEHFEKNFYIEDKRVTARSDKEVEEFRREKEIKVSLVVATISHFLILSSSGSRP